MIGSKGSSWLDGVGIVRFAAVLAYRSRYAGSFLMWSMARRLRIAPVGRVATYGASRSGLASDGGGTFKWAVERRKVEERERHERFSQGAFGATVRGDRWICHLLGWCDTFCGSRWNHWACRCFDALCASVCRHRSHCRLRDLGAWKTGHMCPAGRKK